MNDIEKIIVVDLLVDLALIYVVVVGILIYKIYQQNKNTDVCDCCGFERE